MRSTRSWSEPSGKGVNVALALQAHGGPPVAVLPVGGSAGAQLVEMLNGAGLNYQAVPIAGEVRINISLVQPDGIVTKINEPGPTADRPEGDALLDAAPTRRRRAVGSPAAAACPAGSPTTSTPSSSRPATARRPGRDRHSGAPLVTALAAGPDLIKPNADELADAAGRRVTTIGDVVDAAQELRAPRGEGRAGQPRCRRRAAGRRSPEHVHGAAPVDNVVSTVGAGDAMLAGYLGRRVPPAPESLVSALQWGAAAVQHEGTLFPGGRRRGPSGAGAQDHRDVPSRARHCVNRSDTSSDTR